MSKESWYARGKPENIIRIESNSKDCVVDYDKDRGMYRVSIFDDDHFWDEFWFDAYEEKELDNYFPQTIGGITYYSKAELFEWVKNQQAINKKRLIIGTPVLSEELSNSILQTLSSSKIKPYSQESKMQAESKLDEIIHKRKRINEIKDYKVCCTCKHFCDDWHEERLWCESDNYDDDDCYER